MVVLFIVACWGINTFIRYLGIPGPKEWKLQAQHIMIRKATVMEVKGQIITDSREKLTMKVDGGYDRDCAHINRPGGNPCFRLSSQQVQVSLPTGVAIGLETCPL